MKSNPKTMRFDSKVEEYINKFDGDNFSDKFHNLAYHFMNDERKLKERLKFIEKDIEKKEKRLQELNKMISDVSWLENNFVSLRDSIKRCQGTLNKIVIHE